MPFRVLTPATFDGCMYDIQGGNRPHDQFTLTPSDYNEVPVHPLCSESKSSTGCDATNTMATFSMILPGGVWTIHS